MPRATGETRPHLITATGWRVVGTAAEALLERAADAPLHEDDADRPALAILGQVRPLLGSGSVVPAVLGAISADLIAADQGIAPLSRDRPASRPASRADGFRWEVDGGPGAWMGELVWRHAHPVRAGRSCTTHVIVREQGSRVTVAVRVAPDEHERSGRAAADIPHLRPAFLRTLARTTRLTCDGSLTGAAFVEEHEVDPTLVDFLLSETRQLPVVVLAPLESGGYLIEPEALADELLGIAHLRVLATHPCTFRLTDALGDRRLSAYWGAMRAYLPRFSCADDARRHPLLRRDEVTDPVLRAFLIGRLAAEGAAATRWPSGITRREIPDAKAVAAPPPAEAQPPSAPAVVLDGPTAAVPVDLTEVLGQLSSLVAVHQRIADELEQMRATLAVRSAGTAALDRRLASLERLLAAHLAPPPSAEVTEPTVAAPDEREPAESPAALQDVVRQSGEQDADALVFLEEAERSALDSPYEDPERVRAILDAMALVARRRQEGKLGRSLKDSFRELGVEYRGGIAEGTSQGLREQYRFRGPRGEEIRCEEHIVLGNSYDPRHCLRIYFTSRAANETRFVIGHVGRHFDVKSTT
jgi:hypothetical protein